MKVKVNIKYYKSYIPYRCRKPRYEEVDELVEANIKEICFADLKLKYSWNYTEQIELYEFKNSLYRKANLRDICSGDYEKDRYNTIIEALKWWNLYGSWYYAKGTNSYYGENKSLYESKEDILGRIKKDFQKFLIVDGELYVKDSKPLYHICTFGLGNNHGGTGWMITQSKYNAKTLNKEYKHKCFFEPEEYSESYHEAIRVAENRGDTLDVERFNKYFKENENIINIY